MDYCRDNLVRFNIVFKVRIVRNTIYSTNFPDCRTSMSPGISRMRKYQELHLWQTVACYCVSALASHWSLLLRFCIILASYWSVLYGERKVVKRTGPTEQMKLVCDSLRSTPTHKDLISKIIYRSNVVKY